MLDVILAPGLARRSCRARRSYQQGYQFGARRLQLTVDDHLVEVVLGRHFDAGGLQTPLDGLGCFGAAADQSGLQILPAGWRQKDRESLGHRPLHGPGPGQINLDQVVIQVQNGKPAAVFDGSKFLRDAKYPMPDWSKR